MHQLCKAYIELFAVVGESDHWLYSYEIASAQCVLTDHELGSLLEQFSALVLGH